MEYLVGHHHTYKDIDGLDYQILVEADFLVNYFEDGLDKEHIKKSAEKIFKTETGKKIVNDTIKDVVEVYRKFGFNEEPTGLKYNPTMEK